MLVASLTTKTTPFLADRNSKSTQEEQNIQYFLGGVLKKTTMFIEELAVGKGGGQMPPAKVLLIPSSGTVSIWSLHLPHAQGAKPLLTRRATAPFRSSAWIMWFCPTLPQETLWLHLGCPVQAPHMQGWVVCEVPRQCVPGHWAPRGFCWPVFAQDGG